ncbi:hypothetical protein HYE67_000931 [Fusarium culmorum]|uniref:Uncharacterized protein n=1 Tax=Fusarium culmorum TaxID=5516 RepID=A0A2T4GME3_FUSCU|nr:hypothetical protein FCULG_00002574 [Fusarium culmorum]QPC58700.1 hypothetical protein HYE67_000931 [Fusarium culmorum]
MMTSFAEDRLSWGGPNIGPARKDFAEIGRAGVYGPEDFAERYLRGNAVGGLGLLETKSVVLKTSIPTWHGHSTRDENAAGWLGLFRTGVGDYHLDSLELGPLY